MKGFSIYLAAIALSALTLGSCAAKKDFTEAVRKQYGITDEILPKIQFFISQDIILFRADSESGLAIEDGEVVVSNTASEDQILIKAGTQGIFEKSHGSGKISVRFDPSTNLNPR